MRPGFRRCALVRPKNIRFKEVRLDLPVGPGCLQQGLEGHQATGAAMYEISLKVPR